MDFKAALREGCYCVDLKSATKPAIIEELVDLLVAGGKLREDQRGEVLRAVREREEKVSTGLQHGVAVPHGKTAAMDGMVTVLGLKKDGVEFDSMDGAKSRIFVMTVSSPLRAGPHMEYLAEISKLLNSANLRARLLQAKRVEEMIDILTNPCRPDAVGDMT